MMKRFGWVLPVALTVLLFSWGAFAQQGAAPTAQAPPAAASHEGHPGMKGDQQMKGKMDKGDKAMMMQKCKDFQAMHEQHLADIKAMDARLDEKLAAMNAAKGDEKTAAMAEVINELVSQRKAMHEKMSGFHPGWMCCMMDRKGKKQMSGGMMGEGAKGGMGGMPGCCPGMETQQGPKGGPAGAGAKTGS